MKDCDSAMVSHREEEVVQAGAVKVPRGGTTGPARRKRGGNVEFGGRVFSPTRNWSCKSNE